MKYGGRNGGVADHNVNTAADNNSYLQNIYQNEGQCLFLPFNRARQQNPFFNSIVYPRCVFAGE